MRLVQAGAGIAPGLDAQSGRGLGEGFELEALFWWAICMGFVSTSHARERSH